MIDQHHINLKVSALSDLLAAKHGLRGKTLAVRLDKAGRLLPKRVHREGRIIQDAMDKMHHPKLATTVDAGRLDAAFAYITNHLNDIDPKDRRKGKLLSWLGGQVFNLLVIGAVVITLIMWRGLIG